MSDGTKIEWTDATLNVVNGCSVVSPGCANCYAMRSGGRNLPNHPATGLTKPSKAGHVWTGEVRFNETALLQPLRWKRPRKIFWNAHGDLFHENVPDEWIDRCFAVMALTPHHVHQVLTKRPERMRRYFSEPSHIDGGGQQRGRENEVYEQWRQMREKWRTAEPWTREFDWSFNDASGLGGCRAVFPLLNVWFGVSVEDQKHADERIPLLLDTPAAVRWLSCEPLLGPVDLTKIDTMRFRGCELVNALGGQGMDFLGAPMRRLTKIDWVVAGGESGPGARPMHPDWARSLRDQCAAAAVPFLFKQWGEWFPAKAQGVVVDAHGVRAAHLWSENHSSLLIGKHRAGRLLDGVQHDGYPA